MEDDHGKLHHHRPRRDRPERHRGPRPARPEPARPDLGPPCSRSLRSCRRRRRPRRDRRLFPRNVRGPTGLHGRGRTHGRPCPLRGRPVAWDGNLHREEVPGYSRARGKDRLRGCDVVEIRDGLVVDNTVYWDGAAFARQVGLLPPQGSLADRAMLRPMRRGHNGTRCCPCSCPGYWPCAPRPDSGCNTRRGRDTTRRAGPGGRPRAAPSGSRAVRPDARSS
jgi:hypothetical protein